MLPSEKVKALKNEIRELEKSKMSQPMDEILKVIHKGKNKTKAWDNFLKAFNEGVEGVYKLINNALIQENSNKNK